MPSESPQGRLPGPSDLRLGGLLCLMGKKPKETLNCKWAGLRPSCEKDCKLAEAGFKHPAIIIGIRNDPKEDVRFSEIEFVQVSCFQRNKCSKLILHR